MKTILLLLALSTPLLTSGCDPDRDNDHDLNQNDTPPEKGGAQGNLEDEGGYHDTDSDGVADPADKCPDSAETVNGFNDTDGCPDCLLSTLLVQRPPLALREVGVRTPVTLQRSTSKTAVIPLTKGPDGAQTFMVLSENPFCASYGWQAQETIDGTLGKAYGLRFHLRELRSELLINPSVPKQTFWIVAQRSPTAF